MRSFAGLFVAACVYYFCLIEPERDSVGRWILGGLAISALGGIGAEFFSHILFPLPPAAQQLEFVLEESGEMIGTILVLVGSLMKLEHVAGQAYVPRPSAD